MSLASEYATKVAEFNKLKAPKFEANPRPGGGQNGGVYVTNEGWLETNGFTLTPHQALAFADWIRTVFGEKK